MLIRSKEVPRWRLRAAAGKADGAFFDGTAVAPEERIMRPLFLAWLTLALLLLALGRLSHV